METSQFDLLQLDSNGPSSLLSLLRNQFPEGIAITERSRVVRARKSKQWDYETKQYLEIIFNDEASLEEALSRTFQIRGHTIKFSKTVNSVHGDAYHLSISDIEQLGDPLKYQEYLAQILNEYGIVQHLHLHYTKESNWFTGQGCAIWIGKLSESTRRLPFEDKLKAKISYSSYPTLDTNEVRVRAI